MMGTGCTINGENMKVSLSEYRRLKVVKGDDWWVDHEAEPNGIGNVCLFCDSLIDWAPRDHTMKCPVRRFSTLEEDD